MTWATIADQTRVTRELAVLLYTFLNMILQIWRNIIAILHRLWIWHWLSFGQHWAAVGAPWTTHSPLTRAHSAQLHRNQVWEEGRTGNLYHSPFWTPWPNSWTTGNRAPAESEAEKKYFKFTRTSSFTKERITVIIIIIVFTLQYKAPSRDCCCHLVLYEQKWIELFKALLKECFLDQIKDVKIKPMF